MPDLSLNSELLSYPMFWLMLAVIVAAFTPYVFYMCAVVIANLGGRPVPRFGDTLSMMSGRGGGAREATLEEIAQNTREILTLLSTGAAAASGDPEPETEVPPQEERPNEERRSSDAQDDGIGPETAWSDRRRSDRGREARGTGYAGAERGKTYRPGTGNRATDRPSFSDELRGALTRLGLRESELPDIATLTRAYRSAAKSAHPDRGGGADAFVAVKSAYDTVLSEIEANKRGARAV